MRSWHKLAIGAGALVVVLAAVATVATPKAGATDIMVYKSATCGCCSLWVEHLEANGFNVTTQDVANLGEIKRRHGITADLASCHTAVIGSYVVEGHVPADVIHRLLSERPAVAGLSVPGMPMGSPGMEGDYTERYDILAFDDRGNVAVYESR